MTAGRQLLMLMVLLLLSTHSPCPLALASLFVCQRGAQVPKVIPKGQPSPSLSYCGHLGEHSSLCCAPTDSTCFFFACFASFSRTCSPASHKGPYSNIVANTICLVMWPMVAVNCTVAHNHNGKWPINSAVCLCVHVFQNAHYVAKKTGLLNTAETCQISVQVVRLRHTVHIVSWHRCSHLSPR